MHTTVKRRRIRLAIVSPCPPRACPVATYTDELIRMLRAVTPEIVPSLWAIARDGSGEPVAGGLTAAGVIGFDDPSAYRRAGLRVGRIGASAALLQVGPGTAGGPHGRYLLGLTDELKRQHLPYLVTLHDVRPAMRPDDADVVAALCRDAAGVIVLSQSARTALVHNRIAASGRIAVVPHGAPPELLQRGAEPVGAAIAGVLAPAAGGPLLATLGHLRPAKGLEVAVTALPLLAERHPGVRYVVAGRTHDDQVRLSGEWYRETLAKVAQSLGVADRLSLVDVDPNAAELSALLRATDVYLAPDLDRGRTSGGSLGYALAAGRPVAAAIATAEQIAVLVSLITGSSSRVVRRTNRGPGTFVPAAGVQRPYPHQAPGARVYVTPAGRDHGDSDRNGGIPRKIRHRQDDPPRLPAGGCRRSTSDSPDWTVAS